MTWTNARIEQLKTLWAEGQSASAIASELGGVTRNAVIGKVHRLGLAGRPKTSGPSTTARRSPARRTLGRRAHPLSNNALPPSPKKAVPILAELGPAPRIAVTVATLTADTCRWPEGDPKSPGFHFCGRQKSSSPSSYCAIHTIVARQQDGRDKAAIHHLVRRLPDAHQSPA